jgi:predicted unusual protein kinase regulating ubiquinone biosynthesis (AarF/ABC1/UbiB family)
MSLRPKDLVRYKDIGLLLVKHAVRAKRLADDADPAAAEADGEQLARELEELGPTFVKLGQLLSTRGDLLPAPYLKALSRLQDDVEPFGFEDVERIVSEDIGARMSKAFQSFESAPIAAASLGQVHRAVLHSGKPVAVKVQRPGIRERVTDDMDAIQRVAEFADEHTEAGRLYGFADMVAEFRKSIMIELDYTIEANNLVTLAKNLADRDPIVVPQPVADYTTVRVLTMEYIGGRSIGSLSGAAMLDIDGPGLARALFSAYLQQILIDGFFHADPHPGNVFVTDDGRIALLDLGMVARIDPSMQDTLTKLLLSVSEGRGRDAADIAVDLGTRLDDFDADSFRRDATELIARNQMVTMGDIQAGVLIGELTRISGANGLRLPAELTMLGKALLNLDEVARVLDPTFNPNVTIREEAAELMQRRLANSVSPGNIVSAAMDAKEFAERLPGRINKVMDALAEGQLTLNVQGIDEENIMRGVQKLANRLAAALVVAALVIGAALIMRIPTQTKLLGYPALAIVMFLLAAIAAAFLLGSILLSDLPQKRRRRT